MERNQAELARNRAELKQKESEAHVNKKAINLRNQTLIVLLIVLTIVSIISYRNQLLSKKLKANKRNLEEKQINLQPNIEKVKESERLKSAFLQNMRQGIRTPLNGIVCISTILTDQQNEKDKQHF